MDPPRFVVESVPMSPSTSVETLYASSPDGRAIMGQKLNWSLLPPGVAWKQEVMYVVPKRGAQVRKMRTCSQARARR